MNEAKKHHYIPRSYLRNFAEERNGEHYVYVRYAGEKFHETNIINICSETYFYSIPNAPGDKKNIIEKYYAESIDNLFPEITSVITNDQITEISSEMRKKIISATLSLFFRTPIFLDLLNNHFLKVIDLAKKYTLGATEKYKMDFLGRTIDVRMLDYESLENDFVKQSKIIFLKEHFDVFNTYVDFKMTDAIGVTKIIDDSEFITSDNPVIIRNSKSDDTIDLFDTSNMIHLPINSKYLLTLYPKDQASIRNTFNRIEGQTINVLVINYDIEKRSAKWIIGSKESVNNHLYDQKRYNEPTPENEKMVANKEEEAKALRKFTTILDNNGGVITDEVLKGLKELSENEFTKDDPNLIRDIEGLKAKGYVI